MHIDTGRCLKKRMLNKLLRKRTRLDARKYRESARTRMKNATMSVPLLGKRCEMSNGATDATENDVTIEDEVSIAKNCISSAKRQRENFDSEDLYCLFNTGTSLDLHGISDLKDGKESNSRCSMGLDKNYVDDGRVDPHNGNRKDGGLEVCYNCVCGGMLLSCHGKGCQRRYHPSCLDPPLSYVLPGIWHCIWCVKKKIELGVYSVSEGVESIWNSREMVLENGVMQTQYLVKYQGLAHAHNRWIPEKQLLLEAPKMLAKFNRKVQVIRWKHEWTVPHRLLLKREVVLSKQPDEPSGRHDEDNSDYRYEWLVKWTGLGYEHITWELDDASFMTSTEGMKLTADYEIRHKRTERLSKSSEVHEVLQERKASTVELSELPSGDSPVLYNHLLSYVNKIRMCWQKGQSALIADDQVDQERVKKVILFLLSLHCSIERPILIISTSNTLSVWEEEFLHLAPSANLIVYKGNKDVRNSIRTLEFYKDDGGIMFQILLSSSDIIIEDLHALRYVAWEAIIIDECQLRRISRHFDYIKMLEAEMRLLIISGQIKEQPTDYLRLLSLLDSGFHELKGAQMETNCPTSISKLKKQLAQYIAFECSTSSSRFIEYWVPVQLSNLQLEQYCSMLLSHSMFLCSGLKTNTVDALRDLIISTKKCCDHPYLLDQSLQGFVTKGLPVEEYLNIGIKASGKLQLLDKILMEVRSRGLRVIIIYQSAVGSGSIGDILDDLVCQRFGKESYVRYCRGLIRPKKRAALDMFNDRGSGKFVFLIESRACIPSIKLSSVDSVILFNSDWDPQSDLRSIQKMSISSQFEQLKVFRLYTSFTVEERVLILAKDGVALDSNMQWINQSNCQTLLKWKASYLFSKLDDLHGLSTASDISSDQSLLNDVICELSTQLPYGSDSSYNDNSFILRAAQNGGLYESNILLLGERVTERFDNGPHAFSWTSVLKERDPKWKFLSLSSQRIRKKVTYTDQDLNESDFEHNVTIRKMKRVSDDPIFVKSTMKYKKNPSAVSKASTDIVDPAQLTSRIRKKKKPRAVNISITGINDPSCPKSRSKEKKKQSAIGKTSKGTGCNDDSCEIFDSIAMCHLTSEITRGPKVGVESREKKKLFDMPKSNEVLPKPDILGLCEQLNSAEINADSFNGTAIPVVREWKGAATCICDESTALELTDTTSISQEPFLGNLWLSPQVAGSGIPSFSEDELACTIMPLDMNIYQSNVDRFNIPEAEVILRAPSGPVKSFDTSFVQSMPHVQQQPPFDPPPSENALFGPQSDPEVMNGDLFQGHFLMSEMPHIADLDLFQNEVHRIQKEKEDALKIRDKSMLQLQSDCGKDIEKIYEKYDMLLQDVNAAMVLKKEELEANYNMVLLNNLLAETLNLKLDDCEMVSQCTGQVASSMHQTAHRLAERVRYNFPGLPIDNLPPLAPPVGVISLSTVAPEIRPVRPGCIPMTQQSSANLHNGFEFRAPAPHLRAFISAQSNSLHHVSNPCSGISNQQLPLN